MAGIGFELRKILRRDTLTRTAIAYSMAGLISSGPWIISILGILILGIVLSTMKIYHVSATQFQISITYLIALSLILSGFAQHSFTRYIADQLFLNNQAKVIPNLNGITLLATIISGILSFLFTFFFFPQQSIIYHVCFTGSFVVLCNIWIATNLLAGLKSYSMILGAFFVGYGIALGLGYLLRDYGLEGFMFSFLLGQVLLLILMHIALYRQYFIKQIIDFDFLRKNNIYLTLVITSFFYNLGIWIDKFVFWFTSITSYPVIGPLRGSLIYDIPIFLAYLALLPGMAVFLLRVETDFVDYYHRFYDAIREGQTLAHIKVMHEQMVSYARTAIYEIMKIQVITVILIFLFGTNLLELLNISTIYKNLLFIDVIGASLQVVFLAILNILFYMDRRKDTLILCALFVALNFIFSTITIHL